MLGITASVSLCCDSRTRLETPLWATHCTLLLIHPTHRDILLPHHISTWLGCSAHCHKWNLTQHKFSLLQKKKKVLVMNINSAEDLHCTQPYQGWYGLPCAKRIYFTFNIASSWQSPTYIIDGCFFSLELLPLHYLMTIHPSVSFSSHSKNRDVPFQENFLRLLLLKLLASWNWKHAEWFTDRQDKQVSPFKYYNLNNKVSICAIYSWLVSTSVTTADDHKAFLQTLTFISLNVNHSTLFALLALI